MYMLLGLEHFHTNNTIHMGAAGLLMLREVGLSSAAKDSDH